MDDINIAYAGLITVSDSLNKFCIIDHCLALVHDRSTTLRMIVGPLSDGEV